MKEKYLPIGTVVLLKDASKKIMITGYCSSTPEEPDKVYDYVAHLFPEGSLAGASVALFNHDQIGSIIHMGLDNDEFKNLDKTIKNAMSNPEPEPTSEFDNLAPFTPENINLMLEEIHKHGDEFKPVAEPTAFDDAVMKKPVFELPLLGGDNKTEESEEVETDDDTGVEDAEIPTEEKVPDGQPVLQLQPIFDNVSAGDSTSSDSTVSVSEGVSELPRL